MKIGKGKLLICSADVSKDLAKRPVARQFLYSLTRYMQSKAFEPTTTVDAQILKNLFEQPSREQFNSYAKQVPDELRPKKVGAN